MFFFNSELEEAIRRHPGIKGEKGERGQRVKKSKNLMTRSYLTQNNIRKKLNLFPKKGPPGMTVRGPPGPPGGGGGGGGVGSALSPSDSYCGCNATAVRSIVAGAVGGRGRRVRRVFDWFFF